MLYKTTLLKYKAKDRRPSVACPSSILWAQNRQKRQTNNAYKILETCITDSLQHYPTQEDNFAGAFKVAAACEYAAKFATNDRRIRFVLDHKYTRQILSLVSEAQSRPTRKSTLI
jgi:hypothetical protein